MERGSVALGMWGEMRVVQTSCPREWVGWGLETMEWVPPRSHQWRVGGKMNLSVLKWGKEGLGGVREW